MMTCILLLGAAEVDTVVVCPRELRGALQPWLAHREAQGHRFAFAANTGSPDAIRAAIRSEAKTGALRYVLLVGDAPPAADWNEQVRAVSTPTHKAPAEVVTYWGSTPEIATDNWYADLDDDLAPDVAIGRLTADNPRELAVMVGKILAYEDGSDQRDWRRRISFVAGVGGFGPLVDYLVETAAKKFLCDGIPAEYCTTMTYGSWRSPYCPDPRRFHDAAVGRLNEGCLFWVYIGHGQPSQLDQIRVPGGEFPILDASHMWELRCPQAAPIAVLLACYTGAFDQPYDCLAEEMLRAEGGPVALLCGSRVTMPYAMAVMGNAMMDECFRNRRPTIGDVVLHAKRKRFATPGSSEEEDNAPQAFNRRLLDALAAAVSPKPEQLELERVEHVLLFNLLGDPLMRLQHPREAMLHVSRSVEGGERLEIAGSSPIAGRCTIELVCRRDQMKTKPPARSEFVASEEFLAAFDDAYQQANDSCWTSRQIEIASGPFRTDLVVPLEAHGLCHIRVFVQGRGSFALGAADVLVGQPRLAETAKSLSKNR